MLKESFLKIIKTIDSINTLEHKNVTRKLIENFYKKFGLEYKLLIETYFEYKLEQLKVN